MKLVTVNGELTMRYVRVFAEPIDDPDREWLPICVDAVIDEDGNILGRHAIFGFSGQIDRSRNQGFQPFAINSNGRVDWGDGFDHTPDERYGECDLRQGPLTIGRMLTLSMPNYGEERLRITRIVELPAKRSG